ncbi:MAG: hypothetical protein WB810_12650, partial [Candidatus Cybelea sp.]
MMFWFRHCALGVSLVLLAGCGIPQSTIGGSAMVPQALVPTQDARVGSQMTPHAKSGNLLYVSGYGQETYILSFPKGELIGQISGGGHLCPDNAGNVWIAGYPSGVSNKLAEFARGGITPINTLTAHQTKRLWSCAVDPTTSDVAATGNGHHVFIFSAGSEAAKVLRDRFPPGNCTYD